MNGGNILLQQDGASPLRHFPGNGSNEAQVAHGAPQRRRDFMGSLLTNVRINRAFSAVLTCFFIPENDLWGMLTYHPMRYFTVR